MHGTALPWRSLRRRGGQRRSAPRPLVSSGRAAFHRPATPARLPPAPRTPCCAGLIRRAVTVSTPRATGAAMELMTTRAPSVCRGTLEGFETVTLSAGELEASFAPGLGMAGVSLRHGGEELLDRRAGLSAYAERGAVMGIPILHPWANRLSGFEYPADGRAVRLPDGPPLVRCEEHGLPIHGLLSGSPHWRIPSVAPERDRARLTAELVFDAHPELLAAFPFPHTLGIEAVLDADGITVARRWRRPVRCPCRWLSGFTPTCVSPAPTARRGSSTCRPGGICTPTIAASRPVATRTRTAPGCGSARVASTMGSTASRRTLSSASPVAVGGSS